MLLPQREEGVTPKNEGTDARLRTRSAIRRSELRLLASSLCAALRRVETSFPTAQIVVTFAEVRGEHGQPEQRPIQHVGWKSQGLDEIDEQDHARLAGLVPGLMLVGIIEDQHATLAPGAQLGSDADRQSLAGLRNHEAEMEPQHAVIGAPMRGQALAWLEHGQHRRPQSRPLAHDPPCLGTELDAALRSHAVGDQQEYLPAGILSDGGGIHGDVLDIRQLVLTDEQAIGFAADGPPLALDLRHPGKRRVVVDAGIPELRVAAVWAVPRRARRHQEKHPDGWAPHLPEAPRRPFLSPPGG